MMKDNENMADSVIRVTREAAEASRKYININEIPCAVDGSGNIRVLDEVIEAAENISINPSRRKGTSIHTELESFIEHVNRMKEECTTVWADVEQCTFQAIYNYHPAGDDPSKAGWGDYRSKYSCPLSPEWIAWTDREGQWMTQTDFAQWVDERMEDLIEADDHPKPIELLEMARNLQIRTKGTFSKKIDPTSGEYALESKEEHTKESTSIPRVFTTALRIFEGGQQYRAEIRLQFRIREGRAWFCYTIHRALELKRDAFGEMRQAIAKQTERPVFAGRPD